MDGKWLHNADAVHPTFKDLRTPMNALQISITSLIFCATIAIGSAHPAPYSVVILGAGHASGINDSGEIVGNAYVDGSISTAAIWSKTGVETLLPGLGGVNSQANAINNSGVVAGFTQINSGISEAVKWSSAGDIVPLGEQSGWSASSAFAINSQGQTVGFYAIGLYSPTEYATAWSPTGSPTTLASSGHYTYAYGINASGIAVGWSDTGSALEWSAFGTPTVLDGLATNQLNEAVAINNSGKIAGNAQPISGVSDAVVWSSTGQIMTLSNEGATDTYASAINNLGYVVGTAYWQTTGKIDATLWSPNGSAIDLASVLGAGWTNSSATGINDRGQIVGYGDLGGVPTAFLLTPSAIPEPATWALIVLGCASIGAMIRRRRMNQSPLAHSASVKRG